MQRLLALRNESPFYLSLRMLQRRTPIDVVDKPKVGAEMALRNDMLVIIAAAAVGGSRMSRVL
jgi:hypothetical protein